MNIFSTIWNKHYKRGCSPLKLAEDAGSLRGVFEYVERDVRTGKIVNTFKKNNLLVNDSKSNLIRLISQGTSPWKGALDPETLKISRMRFGNHNPSSTVTPSKLNYYNFYELSSRANSAEDNDGFNPTDDIIETKTRATSSVYFVPYCVATTTPYEVTVPRPPSHGTLIVELLKENVVVETITFGQSVYTRKSDGNVPTKIESTSADSTAWCTTPAERDVDYTKVPTSITTTTRLIYSYLSGAEGWKLILGEIDTDTPRFTQVRFKFKIGANNVINSIVPQTGVNAPFTSSSYDDQMLEIPSRYQPVAGQKDYYEILSNPEYRDSEVDYVDDFSVTFGVNMSGSLGNGDTTDNTDEVVSYKEAFLFNGLDDMFSHVVLPTTFDKNSSNAFFISWTILAPIN